MHHNPRAFDERDPDATQALEDAIPIVEELLAERLKAEPRGHEPRQAWLAYIVEIRSRLTGLATRAGCSVNELEEIAGAEIRQRLRRQPRQAPPFTSPTAPDVGFKELAQQLAGFELKRAELHEEERKLIAARNRVAGQLNAVGANIRRLERRLHRRGRVLA